MSPETLFATAYVLVAAIWLWSLAQLRGFLAGTRSIADDASLERFKALARVQMHLALVMLVVLFGGVAASVFLVARRGVPGLGLVILVNLLVAGLGMYHKRVEVQARSLQAGSEALADEHRRISETWVNKALPDF